MIATACFAWLLVQDAGGLAAIPQQLHHLYDVGVNGMGAGPGGITGTQILAFTPTEAKDVSIALLSVFAIQWIAQINADGTGYLAQRSMACRSDKDAKQAAVVFTLAQIILRSLLWIPIGLALLVIFPHDPATIPAGIGETAWREGTYIRGMAERMPPGMMGLMLTGMLAALGSTVDTHLNWGSSYWTNDIFKRFICRHWLKKEPDPRLLVWVARCSNVMILFIALFVMTRLDSIQTAWQASLLIGAGTGLTLVLRWVWWRFNAWGEIAAITTSLVCVPIILQVIPADQDAVRLLVLTAVATTVAVVVVLNTPAEDHTQLREFYKTAHPPGFWGPIAQGLGEDFMTPRKRMYRALAAVFTASFSIFCVLTGGGSWIAQSPVPAWFPVPALWIPALLLLGLGLVPVWWKLAFGEDHDAYAGVA